MKKAFLAMVLLASFVSTVTLTGCLEQKKSDDSSTTDDGGGGNGGGNGGGTTYTCSSPSSGFTITTSGAIIPSLTVGTTISSITVYFQEHNSSNLGQANMTLEGRNCDFSGSAAASISDSVTTTQAYGWVSHTFTFSTPLTITDCGSGTGQATFKFSSVSYPNSSSTFYIGAQSTSTSSCTNKVTSNNTGTPSVQTGLYSWSGSVQ